MRRVPEVVVRIDDRQIGFQRRLGRPLGEPGLQIGILAIDATAAFALGIAALRHAGFLRSRRAVSDTWGPAYALARQAQVAAMSEPDDRPGCYPRVRHRPGSAHR